MNEHDINLFSTRHEEVNKLYEVYQREHEKLKLYASFDRTLSEIELLLETETEYNEHRY